MSEQRGQHQPQEDGDVLSDLGVATFPADVYEHPEWYGGTEHVAASIAVARAVRGCPEAAVTIYRAVPAGVTTIRHGDWVAVAESYARQHAMQSDDPADDWPVIFATVRAGDVRNGGGDLEEWGYWGADVPADVLGVTA